MRLVFKRCLVALVAAPAATVVIPGCGRTPEIDAIRSTADRLQQQVTEIRADSDQQKGRADALSAKVFKLEVAVADLTSKREEHPSATGPVPLTPSQIAELNKAIGACVLVVKAMAPPGATSTSDVHISFDAYFNPATQRVLNNNQYVSQDAVYAFNKCMTERGWPLN